MDTTKKPTLLNLRQKTVITTQELAQKAGVSLTEAYVVEIGGFVNKETATRVLAAFTQLTGTHYTLNDIRLQNVSTPVTLRTRLSDLETTKYPIPRQDNK